MESGRGKRPAGPPGVTTGVAAAWGLRGSHTCHDNRWGSSFNEQRRPWPACRSYCNSVRARAAPASPKRNARAADAVADAAMPRCRSRPRARSRSPCPSRSRRSAPAKRSSTVEVRAQVTGQLMSVHFTEGAGRAARPAALHDRSAAVRGRGAAGRGHARDATRRRRRTPKRTRARQRGSAQARAASRRPTTTRRRPPPRLRPPWRSPTGAALENAKLQLQYTKIAAPVSGRTGALLVHQGALVRSTDTAPLVVINQISPIRVSVRGARPVPARRSAPARRRPRSLT